MHGGTVPDGYAELAILATAADYYGMLVFEFADRVRRVRERYGDEAAELEVEIALRLRDEKLRAKLEAIEAQQRASG